MSGVCDHAGNKDAHDDNCRRNDDNIGLGHGMLPVAPANAYCLFAPQRPELSETEPATRFL